MQKPGEAPFGHERQAEELNNIFSLDHVQANALRNKLLTRAEQQIPYREHDAIIAVVLAAKCGVMGPVQGGRDDEARETSHRTTTFAGTPNMTVQKHLKRSSRNWSNTWNRKPVVT